MINQMDLELRFGDHAVRVARADREGWWREAPAAAGRGDRRREFTTLVGSMRRRLGGTILGVGERLRGTPADHAAHLSASRYTQDAVQ